jgi:RecA-family ATPase
MIQTNASQVKELFLMENNTPQIPPKEPIRIRKANEYIDELKHWQPAEMLFDEFWREGELALLFGPSGSGKSILAVQIAEAVARGRAIDGFRMPDRGRRVLYVDLDMSGAQFLARITVPNSDKVKVKTHEFSDRFYRESRPDVEDLVGWLRDAVKAMGARSVVIDSLAAVRKTHDGVRETLRLMRELRALRDELGISILVVTDCVDARRGKMLTEADMGRSRVLCGAADSVFAISRHATHIDNRVIVQTLSRNAPLVWTAGNAPLCSIAREETGLLAFRFDELYASKVDTETLELICNLKIARDEGGETFRSAADLFEISRSRAERLYRKWSPAIEAKHRVLLSQKLKEDTKEQHWEKDESYMSSPPVDLIHSANDRTHEWDDLEEYKETGDEEPPWIEIEREKRRRGSTDITETESENVTPSRGMVIPAIPFAAGLRRPTIHELPCRLDEYDKEMYIEKEGFTPDRPKIFYRIDSSGYVVRCERDLYGTTGRRIGPTPYLDVPIRKNGNFVGFRRIFSPWDRDR